MNSPKTAFYLLGVTITIFLIGVLNTHGQWSTTVYYGAVSGDGIVEVLQQTANFNSSNDYLAITLAREISETQEDLIWEFEGQFVKHLGNQQHMEFNGLIIARWHPFPWDHILDTSFAIGEGLSLATEVPEIEKRNHDESNAFLNYLVFEFTLPFPLLRNSEIVARIHHRSGIFGLFDDVTGASKRHRIRYKT